MAFQEAKTTLPLAAQCPASPCEDRRQRRAEPLILSEAPGWQRQAVPPTMGGGGGDAAPRPQDKGHPFPQVAVHSSLNVRARLMDEPEKLPRFKSLWGV